MVMQVAHIESDNGKPPGYLSKHRGLSIECFAAIGLFTKIGISLQCPVQELKKMAAFLY